jgi:hypothetical protein
MIYILKKKIGKKKKLAKKEKKQVGTSIKSDPGSHTPCNNVGTNSTVVCDFQKKSIWVKTFSTRVSKIRQLYFTLKIQNLSKYINLMY